MDKLACKAVSYEEIGQNENDSHKSNSKRKKKQRGEDDYARLSLVSNCTSVSTNIGRDSLLGSSSTLENGCLRIKRADKENTDSE